MTDPTYRTALITGASSGLGRGLARFFAHKGTRVYVAARRVDRLEAFRDELAKENATLVPVALDVSRAEATVERIRALDEESGGLDLVIANAGVGRVTNARKLQWEDVRQTIDVNVTGAAATLSAALPGMVARNRGHLVGISSLSDARGLPKSAAYSASKAFLTTFLEGLRVDLRGTGVHVTAIAPGFVKSEMTAVRKPEGMPFLLETDEACERMGRAILREQAEYRFPWQMATLTRVLRVLPNGLYDTLSRKVV